MTIRRSRGYNFENYLVKELNEYGWMARRLGGSSTGLPDIVATNNIQSKLLSIEAKNSAVSNYLYVPIDEYCRCALMLAMFSLYSQKNIVLAFKFSANQIKAPRLDKKGRELAKRTRKESKQYYFKINSDLNIFNLQSIRCTIDGKLNLIPINPSLDIPMMVYSTYKTIEDLKEDKNHI